MRLMPGVTLESLDKTDIDTLLPFYLWKTNGQRGSSGNIVCRDGKPFKKVTAKEAAWGECIF